MTLDDHLEEQARQSDSLFRSALAREDIGRLSRLRAMAAEAKDCDSFVKSALFVGWTAGDLRSRDLEPAVAILAKALWAEARGDASDEMVLAAWHAFNAERMRILIHCL